MKKEFSLLHDIKPVSAYALDIEYCKWRLEFNQSEESKLKLI